MAPPIKPLAVAFPEWKWLAHWGLCFYVSLLASLLPVRMSDVTGKSGVLIHGHWQKLLAVGRITQCGGTDSQWAALDV